jgi:hypothetical protein
MRDGHRRRKAGRGKEGWTYKTSEKSMASEFLLEKGAVAGIGLDVYAQLSTSSCAMAVLCFKGLGLCRAEKCFRTGGCRIQR